jgi:hypothetical protein
MRHRAPQPPHEALALLFGDDAAVPLSTAVPAAPGRGERGRFALDHNAVADAAALDGAALDAALDAEGDAPGVYTLKPCAAGGCTCNGVEPLWSLPFPTYSALKKFLSNHAPQPPTIRGQRAVSGPVSI